jgi:hypothetical protein
MSKAGIALQEAIRSLEYQERTLDSLRTRATITLTLGYLATGFLLDISSVHGAWFWVGIAAVLGLTTAVVAVHWPAPLWVTFDAYELVSDLVDNEAHDADSMARDLAAHAQELIDLNEGGLRNRTRILIASMVVSGLAIGSFLANVVRQ